MFLSFRFPKDGTILYAELDDQGHELVKKEPGIPALVPILGLLQVSGKNDVKTTNHDGINNEIKQADQNEEKTYVKEQTMAGRLVVYGDSNCIDDNHLQKRVYYRNGVFSRENIYNVKCFTILKIFYLLKK